MTVMRETGLIVMSAEGGYLFQLLLQEGRLIEKQIKCPCQHKYLYLLIYILCVQVAGQEYLALSCSKCRNIKLMNLNKQKVNSSESKLLQYEVITAFSGEMVQRICHGEENRLFVRSSADVMELDTSTTTFTKVRTINISGLGIGFYNYLCYVPHPHRLLVTTGNGDNEVCAVSCDDSKKAWRVESEELYAGNLAYTPTHESIIVTDGFRNQIVIFSPSNGSRWQSIQLPNNVYEIQGLCVYNHQLIVCSIFGITYFSLK